MSREEHEHISDDLLWQAQVMLEHRRRHKLRATIMISLTGILLVSVLLGLVAVGLNVTPSARNGAACCLLPWVLLAQLGLYLVWRCPACDDYLGRSDPQFCPTCGAQLR